MSEPIYHLLKPKEYRTWRIPGRAPGPAMNITQLPSKASCATCLTNFRYATGKGKTFKVRWTSRHDARGYEPPLED